MPPPAVTTDAHTADQLRAENADLRWRLEEAEETLRAIRTGAVDAVVVGGADGRRVYTLDGADRAYRVWVEQMSQGAATLTADGAVAYCNPRLAAVLGVPPEHLVGRPLAVFVAPVDLPRYADLLRAIAGSIELNLARPDGSTVPVLLALNPLPAESGAAVGVLITDLTAQRHHEELAVAHAARRQSEERYRVLATATSDVVYRLSADWAEMSPLDGRDLVASNVEPIRDWMRSNIPTGEHERVTAAIRDAVARKGVFELEHRVNRPDGGVGWTLSRAAPILDAGGEVVEWFGTARDVTARKWTEEELARVTAASEQRKRLYETVLNATPDLVYVFDLDHRFTYANDALLRMWGKSWDEAIGRNCLELGYEPWHAEMHGREIEQVRATGRPVRGEVPFSGTAGRRTYEYIFVPVFGAAGEVEAVAGTTRDVTDRKRAEEELARLATEAERERRLFAAVLNGTPDFIYTFDRDGRFVYINAALLDLWGKRADEAVGRDFHELGYPPALADRLHRQIRQVIDTKQPVRDDTPFTSRQGERMYEYIFVPVVGADGAVEAVAGSTRDITDRKRAEQELREQDQRKDEFLATLAHELRNPLAPVRTGLQVMKLAPDDAPAVARAREMMERQLGHMVRLIDDLLDISRVSRGKVELKTERVDLRAVVETAVETSRPLVDAGRHALTVELPADPVWVDADHTRLAQVVSNVLTNAAKYTPDGGRIALAVRRDGGDAVVSVTDTGLGIPADMLAGVFDMFTQVNRTLDRAQGGLGIGLALVRKLMDMHGGSITADSPGPGLGSTFTVRLPATAPPPSAARPPAERNGRPAVGRRILVVDDNRDGAESLAMLLMILGHATRVAHDGPAALSAAREFDPQVVFLDIGMPGMNGYQVAERFRADERLRGAVLVALTGWGSEDDKARSRAAGFDFHLTKPVEPAAVEGVLARFAVVG